MRVHASTVIAVTPERVWAIVSDPERALSFMAGVTRWEGGGSRASTRREGRAGAVELTSCRWWGLVGWSPRRGICQARTLS